MSSLGGPNKEMSPSEIAALWQAGLADVDALQHQSGNFQVVVRGAQANVFCYGTATQYRKKNTAKPVTTFIGSYSFHLSRPKDKWLIDRFAFHSKYVY
jgi:hypothetical protein